MPLAILFFGKKRALLHEYQPELCKSKFWPPPVFNLLIIEQRDFILNTRSIKEK
jgi:hypothetical protein